MSLKILKVAFAVFLFVAPTAPASSQTPIDTEAALQERTLGEPAAPVTVIEYASMTCPHCASFHNDTLKTFKSNYVDTGKVRLIYRDFPLDGVALRAAAMARCAVDERYFPLVQLLYKSQQQWTHARDPVAELAKIGRLAGIDQATFEACTSSEKLLNGILHKRQLGAAAGVRSTPTFIINDVVYPGSRSIEELSAIIDPLLAAD